MIGTTFTKLLLGAGIAFLGASSANAVVMTYKDLTCEYSAQLVQYDTVRTVKITNTGSGTVPANASYTVSRAKPPGTIKLKLSQALGPGQQGSTSIGQDLGSPRCSATASWYVANEVVPH